MFSSSHWLGLSVNSTLFKQLCTSSSNHVWINFSIEWLLKLVTSGHACKIMEQNLCVTSEQFWAIYASYHIPTSFYSKSQGPVTPCLNLLGCSYRTESFLNETEDRDNAKSIFGTWPFLTDCPFCSLSFNHC
jgi:hypothetical protein